MSLRSKMLATAVAAPLLAASVAYGAEPGFYIGASAGQTTAKADATLPLVGGGTNTFHFDKQETGYKGYVGYNFLPWLGVEGGYVDLGSPEDHVTLTSGAGINGKADITGWEGFLVGILPIGPVDLFGKAGAINADADLKISGSALPTNFNAHDSNSKFAWGAGLAWNLGHWALRAEYEEYDTNALDDLYFISGGVTYRFGGEKPKPAPVVAAAPPPAPAPKPTPPPPPAKCPDGDEDGVCDAVDQCPNTPAGARVDAIGCDCDFTMHLQFALNSAELSDGDKQQLDTLIQTLKNPKLNFVSATVDGYTDSTGTEEYNLGLSKRRAESVMNYLHAGGVALGDRFAVNGYGEANPVASNATKEGRAENRRVVIHRTDCGR
jgi:outer membrane protein OmpA-like peptidoglycan-associated protein